MARSSGGSVVLKSLEFLSSGTYRCEVIAEAPVFHTKLGEANLTVIGEEDGVKEEGYSAWKVK